MRLLVEGGGRAVGIQDGRIVPATGRFERVLHIPDGEVLPGLLNSHDHLHRNHYGRLGHPPYADAYEWGRDIHTRWPDPIRQASALPRRDALLVGAWKNLFAGVTTVVHHDDWEPDFQRRFPLRVLPLRCVHSPIFDAGGLLREARRAVVDDTPLCIHLAEGVNPGAADEVRTLDRLALLDSRLLAVHAVGADEDGIRRLRLAGAACVWCPTSNFFLFGRTAPPALLAPGTDVLLGSDSLLTSDGDLLDEIRAARGLRLIEDDRLLAAVGITAARRLGLPRPSLDPGSRADLVVLRRPLLEAHRSDVALVVVAGVLRLAAPDIDGLERFELREVQGPGGVRRLIGRDADWPAVLAAGWGEELPADGRRSAVHAAPQEQPRSPAPHLQQPRH